MFAVIHIPNFSLQAVLRHEGEVCNQQVAPTHPEGVPEWNGARVCDPQQPGLPNVRTSFNCVSSFEPAAAHRAALRLGEGVLLPEFREPLSKCASVALVDPELSKPHIVQLNSMARHHGVVEGLTASQAMARCGNLLIKTRSRSQEEACTEVLLQTAYAFAATIESTALGVCTVELKGLGIETAADMEAWATNILKEFQQFSLEVQIGICVTPALALLVARAANPIAVVKSPAEYISSLPIGVLEPPPEIAEILRRWGIRTVGALIELGKDKIGERLGTEALELFDRVSPDSIRPLTLVSPTEHFSEQMDFEHEIETAQTLLFVLRRFVEQLSRRMELSCLVVAEFQLQLGLSSGASYERTFKIPSPTGDVETLFRTLHTHLEMLRTNSPIVSLKLIAKPVRPETHQFGLFETVLRNPNQFAETLARLTALCGPDRVGTPVVEETHRADAFRMKTPDFTGPTKKDSRMPLSQGPQLRRFRPPVFATIELRDDQPALIRSQVVKGVIAGVRGPFVTSGHWWEGNRWAREEWDVQTTDGALFRMFRSQEGCFVEGVYD